MTNITIHADCENSPKKQLLRDLNIAYARADVEAVLACLTDDIVWHILGEFEMRGKKQAREVLGMMKDGDTSGLVINSIITDGSEGAVSGVITTADGKSFAFCDHCQFSSAAGNLIKSLKSYSIEIKAED